MNKLQTIRVDLAKNVIRVSWRGQLFPYNSVKCQTETIKQHLFWSRPSMRTKRESSLAPKPLPRPVVITTAHDVPG